MSGVAVDRWPVGVDSAGETEWGYGLMDDEMTPYMPGINCLECGRFVGRDGHISVTHFEMSSEIAYVEGECASCEAADRLAHPERYGLTASTQPPSTPPATSRGEG